MSQFLLHAFRKRSRYNYKCCPLKDVGECRDGKQWKFTPYSSHGSGSIIYLEKHEVDCGTTGFISDFELERESSNATIRYKYSCCYLKSPWDSKTSCYSNETAMSNNGFGMIYYLRMHNIECSSGYALSYFKFKLSENKRQMAYDFRCCKVNA